MPITQIAQGLASTARTGENELSANALLGLGDDQHVTEQDQMSLLGL